MFEVIGVKMQISERMNECARFESTNLSDHHGKESIRRDVERNAEEKIGAALVKLAT